MATATETALSHIQKAIELQPDTDAHAIKSQIYGNAHTVKLATTPTHWKLPGCLHQGC